MAARKRATSAQHAAVPDWATAVAEVLGDLNPREDHIWDDAQAVTDALMTLAGTGRAVATYPGHAVLPVTSVRATRQAEPGFTRYGDSTKGRAQSLADTAFALQSEAATWIVSVATLTYVAPRRGQPAERALFHLWLGDVKGAPFIHEDLPKAVHFGGRQALLLADSDFDTDWLVRDGIDLTQADEIGKALRGDRPRHSYVSPDEQARKQEAIASVQAAYLAHRGPRPRALSQPDVDVIVREGLAHGLLINLELVHAVTDGRGSPNAIYPKLADAMGRLAPRRPAADEVDPALRALWESLRAEAIVAATTALEPERSALAADQAALARAQAALVEERERDGRANAERERQHQRLEADLAKANERIDSLVNVERGNVAEIAQLKAERDALRGQLSDATTALSALKMDLEAQREAHTRTLAAERELATAEREAATSARDLAAAQLSQLKDQLVDLRRDSEKKLTELQDAHQQEVAQLREALAAARRETATAETRCVAAQQDLAEARASIVAAETQLGTTRTELQQRIDAALEDAAAARQSLAVLEGEHRAVVGERDRLDRLLARLRPETRDK